MYNIREGCFVLKARFHNKSTGLDFLLLKLKFFIIKRNNEWIVYLTAKAFRQGKRKGKI